MGVRVLKDYLLYAERRSSAKGTLSGRPFDSDFEYQVAERLIQPGFEVDVQVGVSRNFVSTLRSSTGDARPFTSLAWSATAPPIIRAAARAIAIACAKRSCADWDGTLFRIWSTDWFSDPKGSTDRLVREIERLEALPR